MKKAQLNGLNKNGSTDRRYFWTITDTLGRTSTYRSRFDNAANVLMQCVRMGRILSKVPTPVGA